MESNGHIGGGEVEYLYIKTINNTIENILSKLQL